MMLSHGFKLIVIGYMYSIFAIINCCELNDFFGIVFTIGHDVNFLYISKA